MAGKGDIDIGINVKDEGVTAAVNAIFNGAVGGAENLNRILGIEVQKKLVVETFFDPSTARKGLQVVERDVNNLGAQIEKLAENSKKLEFGSATSLKGQIREATQARDQIKRYEESVGQLGQRVRTVNADWAAQNTKVQDLSRQLSVASANGFWAQVKAGFNLQGLSNFSNGLVSVTQGLQSASILIGQVTASFNQLFTALAKIQQFELAFKAIGASASETSLAFQESERIALGLGVGIQTVRDAFQQLSPVILASGGSIGDVSAITEALSSRFSAFGLSADQSRRVMNGVIQAFGKGKLMAEELTQQISEADPAFRVDLASAIGVTVAQLGEMVKAGEITSDRLIDILPLLSKSSLLFGMLGDSGASAVAALGKGTVTITQVRTQLETLNQLSFERLAGSLEPFLVALLKVQAVFVDFGTAISSSTALKAFGEFLGQVVSQAGGVIDVISKIALTFLSIVEAIGIVINTIDNFTEKITKGIGGVRVVVTALAALITAKLVVALVQLSATLVGTVVRGLAALTASAAASGGGIKGIAAAITGNIASFIGLDAATKKLIASNYQLVASTGGVTAALQGAGAAAKTAMASLLGVKGGVKITGLDSIAKEATAGAEALKTVAPAAQSVAQSTQLAIPGLTATGKAITGLGTATQLAIPGFAAAGEATKAYTKGTMALYLASVEGAGGVAKVAGAAQAGLPAFVPFTAAIQGAKGAAAGLGPAGAAGALGVGAAGVAAGAATAPTLTFAGAVAAAKVEMAAAAVSAGAFAVAATPIILVAALIAGLVVGVLALNGAFSGSDASIKAFDAGIEGIKERSDKAIAAIDAAGDSAADFEERLNNLKVTNNFGGELAKQLAGFPPMVRRAQQEFQKMEKISADSFKGAEKAVADYNKEQDESGKGALKVAQYVSNAEDTIQQALQATKRKRAELEAAAKAGGGTIDAENKRLLEGYNENIRALERRKKAVEELKRSAVGKGIEIPITTVDRTEAAIKEIESRIKQVDLTLNVDAEKAKTAYFEVEALKIELEGLKGNSYKLNVDVQFKVDQAVLQNTLDLSNAIETNLRSVETVANAAKSVIIASLSAQETGVNREIDGLKKAEEIRQKGAQDEIDHLNNTGASKQTIRNAEARHESDKRAAQSLIETGENRLKEIAEQKRQVELKAAQARLDALPAIQAAEIASLHAAQELRDLALETLRIEQEQALSALERLRAEAAAKKANIKDPKSQEATQAQNLINNLDGAITRQKTLLGITNKRLETETKIANLERATLNNNQNAELLESSAKVIELGGTVKITTVDASSVEPVKVAAQTELQNDPKLQKLVNDGKEVNVKIVPQTKEATKKIDDFFKEVEKGPDPKLLKKWDNIFKTVSPEIIEAEIISKIAPPDPGPAKEVINDLSREGVNIASAITTPDTSKAQAAIDDLNRSSVRVTPVLESVEDAMVRSQLHALTQSDVTFNTKLGPLDESEATRGINALRAQGIGIPVKLEAGENPADTILKRIGEPQILFEYRIKNEAEFDRLEASINKQYPIEFRANAAEVERKLFELEERKRMIQLGVVSEPGELERINSEISKLEQQRRIIQIEYEKPSAAALQEWTRSGVNIPVKLETQVVENELQRLEERRRQILLGIDAGPGDLERVENQLRSLEARRTRIQVAYNSPNPEAINQLGRELEARNLRLKTSLQAPDPTPVNTQTAALAATPIVLRPTVAPLPTDATKAQAAALATTPVSLKPSVAPLPTEPTKAQAAALAATPIALNAGIKPIDTTAAKTELAAFANAGVNVPLTVNPDTAAAKVALGGIRAEGDAISASINSATTATAGLGLQAQAATSPFNLLGTATAGLQTSSTTIQGNLAGIGPAATLASQPVNLLGTALAGASTDALATATSVGKIALGGQAASTAFGEFLLSTGGINSAVGTVTTSAETLKSAFVEAGTALDLTKTTVDTISTGTSVAGQNIKAAAASGETLGTALSDSATSSGKLSTALSEVSTGAGTAATNVSVVDTNLQSSVTTANTLTTALNASAQAARNIRIPGGGNNYFAGGRVQGGAAVTVNEFGKEMFLSNSGKLSRINAPAWGTWRAPSSGTIIPAHIAAGINIPRGGVKVSSPGTSFSPSSSKKGGSGLGRVVANLLSALNASQNARQSNSDSIQAAQASQIGKLSRAVDSLANKDLNVNSDAIQASQALEIGKLSRAVDKLAKKDWNVNVAVRGSSSTTYLDALNRSM